jgi:pyroglutamyl-peptidase
MKTVLLTGFEAFGREKVNPSWRAVKQLDGRTIRGHRIVARRLPTTYQGSLERVLGHLRSIRPALVICVGEAAGRGEVTVERVAINVDDSRIPDNAGRKPVDVPVVPGGPVAYWSTLPIKTIVRVLRGSGIPASVSQSAGTFVCNHVFYGLMHALAERADQTKGGFIHVPLLPEQVVCRARRRSRGTAAAHPKGKTDLPSLPLKTMADALAIAVRESLRTTLPVRVRLNRKTLIGP